MTTALSKILALLMLGIAALTVGSPGDPLYVPGMVRSLSDSALTPPPQLDPRRGWDVAPGIRLTHFAEGTGESALVIHGGPGYAPSRPWLAGALLSTRLRLHYYAQRGCGLSTHPVDSIAKPFPERLIEAESVLGLTQQIADIERTRRLLGEEKLLLVGHSFGGLIAALYAAEFPEHVSRLVLVAPADLVTTPGAPEANLFEQVEQRMPESLQSEYADYLRAFFDFPALSSKKDAELSEFYARFQKYYAAATGNPAVAHGGGSVGGWMSLAIYTSLGQHHDYAAALHAVTAPVLVIHGDRDLTPVTVSEHFASYFPNARFVRIASAGHFPFDESPAAFADEVAAFLSR